MTLRTRDPSMANPSDLSPGIERHEPTILAPVDVISSVIQPLDEEADDAARTGTELEAEESEEKESEESEESEEEESEEKESEESEESEEEVEKEPEESEVEKEPEESEEEESEVEKEPEESEEEEDKYSSDDWSELGDSDEDWDEMGHGTLNAALVNLKFEIAKSVIESLPFVFPTTTKEKEKEKEKEEEKEDADCGICKNEFLAEEKARKLPCCHFYHEECILGWLKKRRRCPLCRLYEEKKQHSVIGLGVHTAPAEMLSTSTPSSIV